MKKPSLLPFVFFAAILCAAQAIAGSTPPPGANELAATGNNSDHLDR
jgi:hypothetical protein